MEEKNNQHHTNKEIIVNSKEITEFNQILTEFKGQLSYLNDKFKVISECMV